VARRIETFAKAAKNTESIDEVLSGRQLGKVGPRHPADWLRPGHPPNGQVTRERNGNQAARLSAKPCLWTTASTI